MSIKRRRKKNKHKREKKSFQKYLIILFSQVGQEFLSQVYFLLIANSPVQK